MSTKAWSGVLSLQVISHQTDQPTIRSQLSKLSSHSLRKYLNPVLVNQSWSLWWNLSSKWQLSSQSSSWIFRNLRSQSIANHPLLLSHRVRVHLDQALKNLLDQLQLNHRQLSQYQNQADWRSLLAHQRALLHQQVDLLWALTIQSQRITTPCIQDQCTVETGDKFTCLTGYV